MARFHINQGNSRRARGGRSNSMARMNDARIIAAARKAFGNPLFNIFRADNRTGEVTKVTKWRFKSEIRMSRTISKMRGANPYADVADIVFDEMKSHNATVCSESGVFWLEPVSELSSPEFKEAA